MWKRLQGHGREKEKHTQIGNPVLLETTYDEDQLRRNPNVADVQNAHHQHNAPAPLLSYSLAPQGSPDYRASEVPTISESSMYSRPSHDLSYYYQNQTATSPSAYNDISPPSSPEIEQQHLSIPEEPSRLQSGREISPMDEHRKRLMAKRRTSSNVPVLKRAPPALQSGDLDAGPKQKFWEGKLALNNKVKWDMYSGEPTLSSTGKAASVTPGSYATGAAHIEPPPMGYHVSVSGPQRKASLAERMGRFGTKQPVEPWSRATGRSEIAPALQDNLSSKPLPLPRKALSPAAECTDQKTPTALAASAYHDPSAADTPRAASETHHLDSHNDVIKPIVPLKVGRTTPPRSGFSSPTSLTNPGLGIHPFSYPSPITPTYRQPLPNPEATQQIGPNAAASHPGLRSATPPYNTAGSDAASETPEKDKQVPTSRFSWTTYNSGTTYQHSPPPSPPPLPALTTPVPRQRVVTEPTPTPAVDSILNRRRPIPSADAPTRKPVATEPLDTPKPATSMLTFSPRGPPSPSAASTFSTATAGTFKALPVPPTSASASDHISLLESQIEDLRIRRNNVYRLLSDLNNAAPPNPLVTDFRRARLADQRKRAFEDELSEIRREEHDVGLKLHRAWKKREREDPQAAGSALWVRRVTS